MSNKRYEKFHKITGEQLSRSLFLKKLQTYTAQKMKFSIKDFYSKCDQIHSSFGFGHIFWRMENFIFFVLCYSTSFTGDCLNNLLELSMVFDPVKKI